MATDNQRPDEDKSTHKYMQVCIHLYVQQKDSKDIVTQIELFIWIGNRYMYYISVTPETEQNNKVEAKPVHNQPPDCM